MRKLEHFGNANKKFQKSLDKDFSTKKSDNKNIKGSKNRPEADNFGKKYDELFNKFAMEYPKYQDPASVPFDTNSQDSIDLFQKNSQIKDEIIKRVTAELRKGEVVPTVKEEVSDRKVDIVSRTEAPNIVNEVKTEEPIQEEPVVENPEAKESEVVENNDTIVPVMEKIIPKPIEPVKEFKPFSKKELKTATIYDLQKRGYTTKDPEFKMVLDRGIAKSEARINRISNKNKKELVGGSKINADMLFEMGGPQAGEILNVNENGKTFKYTILENDGKNIVFSIDGAGEQKISLNNAKNFLSAPGISFEFAGEPEEKAEDEALAEVEATEEVVEETGLTPEEEILHEQLQHEIKQLEKEITELKQGKEEFLLKESEKIILQTSEINNIEDIIKDENIRKVFELVEFSLNNKDSVLTAEQEDLLGKHKNIVRQITGIQANKELAEKNLIKLLTEKSSGGLPIIKNQEAFKRELQIIKDKYYEQLSELK